MSTNAVNRYFEGLLVGGTLGFVIGMLTAPKPGAEMRKELAENADEFVKYAEDQWGEIKDQVSDKVQPITEKSKMLKDKVNVIADQAKVRALSIKDKVTDEASELKEKAQGLKDKALELKDKAAEKIQDYSSESDKDVMNNYMGNNSGPMYTPSSRATGEQSTHSLGDAQSTYKPNVSDTAGS